MAASSLHYPGISLFLWQSCEEWCGWQALGKLGKRKFLSRENDGKDVVFFLEPGSWGISASTVRGADGMRQAIGGPGELFTVHLPSTNSPSAFMLSPLVPLTGTPPSPLQPLRLDQSSSAEQWDLFLQPSPNLPTLGGPYSPTQATTAQRFK